MKIICSDVNILKSSFEAISKIVAEVQVEIDSDGMRLNAINPSHTTFVHLNINKSEFDVFECDVPRKIAFTTDDFLKYLKRVGRNDLLELSADEKYLTIHSEGNTNKTFKLKLIEIDYAVPDFPELEFSMNVDMDTKIFKEICTDIVDFSQKLRIYNEGNIIMFEAFGDFVDAEIEYVCSNDAKQQYASIYDLEMIKDMLKADKFASKTTLSYGDDMPLLVDMKSENENQNLCFLLAPRIEEEY